MISFTYRVTHLPSGKHYYGVKYANDCHPKDLWTTYFTSSKYVKELIEETGIESFIFEIRKTFQNENEARLWEHKVNKKVMNWSNYLNDQCGTSFGTELASKGGKNLAERRKEDLSLTKFLSIISSQTLTKTHQEGKIRYDTFTGKKHLSETIVKMKNSHQNIHDGELNSQFGTFWIYNENLQKCIKIKTDLEKYLSEGWKRGRKMKYKNGACA